MKISSRAVFFAGAFAIAFGGAGILKTNAATPNVLIVGGGPNLSHNQVAIESNVRYLSRLLPPDSPKKILFADGDSQTKDVLYLDKDGKNQYRAPQIPTIDGPTLLPEFDSHLQSLTQGSAKPLLLYFTGHGSPDGDTYNNNRYDMWDGDELTVKHLARVMKTLPPTMPVTIVMVQCFSGSFGNVLFQNADPTGPLVDRPICGFFASIAQRMAAGCTAAINEADYHDFTGYFFAALTGTDRLGRTVSGADYNHDGRVGMNEAFAYTLIHDDSIDTPVCTSDVFLRRFVKTSTVEAFQSPYSQIQAWASPAQLAALNGLSDYLKLTGEDRLARANERFTKTNTNSENPDDVHLIRFVRIGRTIVLAHNLAISTDDILKKRYAALIAAEADNPMSARMTSDGS